MKQDIGMPRPQGGHNTADRSLNNMYDIDIVRDKDKNPALKARWSRRGKNYSCFFFNRHDYSHVLVGLARASFSPKSLMNQLARHDSRQSS